MDKHQHNNNQSFRYETTKQVWGGYKERAYEALSQVIIDPQTEEYFFDYLQEHYPAIYNVIEWAKFYDYSYKLHDRKKFKFRQVVINLQPIPSARNLLFDERGKIALATSWYPSVTGSRAWINNKKWSSSAKLKSIGDLISILPIENSAQIVIEGKSRLQGTSFKLQGGKGAILLDCGFSGSMIERGAYSFIFISHYHRDHSGGIMNAVENNPTIPIVASRTSFAYFESLPFISASVKDKLKSNGLLPDQIKSVNFEDKCTYEFFPVYHAPGSYGIRIVDSNNTHLTFLGDLCLRNGFHEPYKEIIQRLCQQKGRKNYVLVDCAMLNNREVIEIEDKPTTILKRISEDGTKRNIIVLSDQLENTIYSYMLTLTYHQNLMI